MKTGEEQGFREVTKVADWSDNDESRRRQLREDASRSLAEGLALSEFLSTFTGAAVEALEAGRDGKGSGAG